MTYSALFETVTLIICITALMFIPRITDAILEKTPKRLLAISLLVLTFSALSNTLQHLQITDYFDPIEDFVEVFFPLFFLSFCYATVTSRRITELKEAHSLLHQERNRIQQYLNVAGVMILVLDLDGTIRLINRKGCEILGAPEDKLTGRNWFDNFLPEHLRNDIREFFQQILTSPDAEVTDAENEVITSDGTLRVIDWHNVLLRDDTGRPTAVLCSGTDVTERRQAEEALRRSEENYRLFFENVHDVIYSVDRDFRVLSVSPSVEPILGYRPEEMIGASFPDLGIIPEEYLEKALADTMRVLGGENVSSTTYEFITRDGRRRFGEISGAPLYRDGEVTAVISVARDITDRKRIENALEESEKRYRELVRFAPAGIYEVDYRENRFISVNEVMCEYTGYTRDELLTMNLFDLFTEESRALALQRIDQLSRGESVPDSVEYRIRTKGGRDIWILLNARYQFEEGELRGASGVIYDITEQVRAKEAVEESERRYQALFDRSLDAVFINDFDGNFLDANDAALNMLGYSRNEIPSLNFLSFLDEEQMMKVASILDELKETGFQKGLSEFRLRRKDGTHIYVETEAAAIVREGSAYAIQGIARDITGRKKAEEERERSLREKEALLREIHHRVKNNMQVISSMMSLQLDQTDDENIRALLEESRSRVRSMALIHEKLYLSGDLSRVNFGEYLDGLAKHLFQTYSDMAGHISLETRIEDIEFEIETAIPCGLITNELISNSLKHAFPGNRNGSILVAMAKNSDGSYTLTVSDDGIGFPEGLKPSEAKSFGLQLVQILTEQLDGTLSIEGTEGTTVSLTFTKPQYSRRY